MADKLTHFDSAGRPVMVDVSGKTETVRVAVAEGRVRMRPDTLAAALAGGPKGDPRRTAEIAGIMAAKRTSDLIPMCHPLAISSVSVQIEPDHDLPGFIVTARVKVTGPTGVEMEALTAASIACLTLYDMLKALEKGMTIEAVRLLEKTGGKSGAYVRSSDDG
jgi:cyclic pyranopterin monophosphate synthase